MKIVLDIGHTREHPGAANGTHGIDEFTLNNIEAVGLKQMLEKDGHEVTVFYRDTYENLPKQINALNPDIILSLHHNAAAAKEAEGTEVLHWHSSRLGQILATSLQRNICNALGTKDRGLKPIKYDDRGGHQLGGTKAPCVILEPIFMSNDNELEMFLHKITNYQYAILNSVAEFEGVRQ
jgi:N-acetylmuramoyl-L-alanine amidase